MRIASAAITLATLLAATPILVASAEAQQRRATGGTVVTVTPRSTTIAGTMPTNSELIGRDFHRNRPWGNTGTDLPGYSGEQRTGRGLAIPFFGPLGSKGPGER
jgi:hypothetical protein